MSGSRRGRGGSGRRARALGAVLASASLVLGGCASGATEPTTSSDGVSGELTIFAAASLAAAFEELASDFEAEHPGVDVRPIVADGSSTLATQLVEGAPADVFAAADERTMATVADADLLASEPEVFATNTLRIVVPPGNPGGVTAIEDLANPGLQVVLCAPEVPCGAASRQLLELDAVPVNPVSEEQNVTAVLAKVVNGEADAGLVYATDATAAADSVEEVVPRNADEVVNRYPIAGLADAMNPEAAAAFVAFVRADPGRSLLARFGFGAP